MMMLAGLFLLVGQCPSQLPPELGAIRAKRDADAAAVRSFTLRAIGIEKDELLSPAGEELLRDTFLARYERLRDRAQTPAAEARAAERLGRAERTVQESILAIRERNSPSSVKVTVSFDACLPAVMREFIDMRNVGGIAESLALGRVATANLDKSRTTVAMDKEFIFYNRALATKRQTLLDVDRERLLLLGIVPSDCLDKNHAATEQNADGIVAVRTQSMDGTIEKVFKLDSQNNYRVIDYTLIEGGKICEEWSAGSYTWVSSVSGAERILVPYNTTHRRAKHGVPGAYTLRLSIESFELNPRIDSTKFKIPEDVRVIEAGTTRRPE